MYLAGRTCTQQQWAPPALAHTHTHTRAKLGQAGEMLWRGSSARQYGQQTIPPVPYHDRRLQLFSQPVETLHLGVARASHFHFFVPEMGSPQILRMESPPTLLVLRWMYLNNQSWMLQVVTADDYNSTGDGSVLAYCSRLPRLPALFVSTTRLNQMNSRCESTSP